MPKTNPADGCGETAPFAITYGKDCQWQIFHKNCNLFRPEQLTSGSIIVRNSIIAAKSLSLCQ
ncbi:hypothetical protein GN277_01125 [Lachnospiraceae bacterium WCA-9-b2]|uniref:Uncharacterized protein n=1 Tax=Sporofaciens musculi TaxID=2681861 RepID=A0A7X3MCW5_9FIRM|nr:hypothetical protein [Sporofaciens musculi]MXP74086.1 hypothetical protein [Sporofaciens musculi]